MVKIYRVRVDVQKGEFNFPKQEGSANNGMIISKDRESRHDKQQLWDDHPTIESVILYRKDDHPALGRLLVKVKAISTVDNHFFGPGLI